ncbi:MAG: hypothetical protein AAF328_11230 [Planctomycetota bacterium]
MRDLPPRLDFQRTVSGQRLTLPRRRAGKGLIALLITTLFGAFFAGVPTATFILPALQELLDRETSGPARGFSFFGFAMALPFLIIGTSVALGPWLVMLSRTTLILEHDELRVFRGIGPFGFSRRRTTRNLAGFEVEVGTSRSNGGPAKPMNNVAMLVAKYRDDAKPFYLAVGYPRDLMNELAESLRETLQPRGWTTAEPQLTITESVGRGDRESSPAPTSHDESIPEQPAKSKITFEEHGRRAIYAVPPRGLIRGSHGLWFFALFWNAITWGFVVAALSGTVEWEGGNAPPWYFLIPFLGVFVLIGLVVAYHAVRMGTRRVRFEIDRVTDPPSLRLTDRHWLRHTVIDLHPGDLTAVRVAHSGLSSNDKPVKHLKLHVTPRVAENLPKRFRKNAEIGLFVERKENELRWLAARLRQDLQVPANPPTP